MYGLYDNGVMVGWGGGVGGGGGHGREFYFRACLHGGRVPRLTGLPG